MQVDRLIVTALLGAHAGTALAPNRPPSTPTAAIWNPSLSSTLFLSTSGTEIGTGLAGVAAFDSWLLNTQGFMCDDRITHALFGDGLRGLAWKGPKKDASGLLASVPSSVVLQSDESQPNWDAVLASKLWKEVLKGSNSSIHGYISLLTKGRFDAGTTSSSTGVPPSTAPNALRHWTPAQRSMLSETSLGQKLLDIEARQARDWQEKYQQLAAVDRPASLEQFTWAMEVVHSRAFRGVSQNLVSSLPAILAPIAAGIMGWAYVATTAVPNELVLAGLGLLAFVPAVVNRVSGATGGGGKRSVVLLPLIDSANHVESVSSSIDYNPLSGAFELSLKPDCILVDEQNRQQQLCISYGNKGDLELLLNYGFLPGVEGGDGVDEESARERQRRNLAEAIVSRN